jgi:hypothetical protein
MNMAQRIAGIIETRSARTAIAAFCLALCASAGIAQTESSLTLRGGATAPDGELTDCSIEGVVVASPVTGEVIIGWDRVRAVTGEHADQAGAFLDVADQLWRAVSRLERGDIPASEPLLEGLFATYRNRSGPTAAAVSGGLLRCRLERGAHTLAVDAWLSWLHATARDDGPTWFDHAAGVDPVLPVADQETGLLPGLPPIWLDLPSVRVFGNAPPSVSQFGDREQALAELYRHAARAQRGAREPMPRLTNPDPAVRLVWDLVAAQSRNDPERATGRKAIEVRLRKEPVGWLDAWLRVGLGRSLLLEAEPVQRQRGVIELLRVHVTHQRDSAYLSGLALADAAVALAELGEEPGASRLRQELLDNFPGHPATGWDPIMLWESPISTRPPRQYQNPHDLRDRTNTAVALRESRNPNG